LKGVTTAGLVGRRSPTAGSSPASTIAASIGDSLYSCATVIAVLKVKASNKMIRVNKVLYFISQHSCLNPFEKIKDALIAYSPFVIIICSCCNERRIGSGMGLLLTQVLLLSPFRIDRGIGNKKEIFR
jgi:hypothetical protein